MNHFLPTATTSDEKERGAECAVLPVGSFEQHGDYLPLITDTVIATVVSRELASAYPLLQLPPVTISCSHEHSAWRGTVSISSSTLHCHRRRHLPLHHGFWPDLAGRRELPRG